MNVYETDQRSPDDVRKWSNECDAKKTAFDRETIRCSDDCLIARTASDADAIRCTGGCLVSKTLLHPAPSRSDERQLMPELLHPIAMRLNARWRLSDCQTAAPDADVIKCTLTIVSWRGLDNADCASNVRKIAPDPGRSDALARLSVMPDHCTRPRTIRCTDEVVCCQTAAPDPGRSDALTILSVARLLHPTPNGQMHWRFCLLPDCCTRPRTIRCTGDFVCFLACYRAVGRTSS